MAGAIKGMLPVKCGWGNQGHATCKTPSLRQSLFIVSIKFLEDHKTVTKLRCIWPPSVLGILPDLKQWCLYTMRARGQRETFRQLDSFPDHKLVSKPHFLKMVAWIGAIGPPHILELWMVTSKSMPILGHYYSNKSSLLWQVNFITLMRLSQA